VAGAGARAASGRRTRWGKAAGAGACVDRRRGMRRPEKGHAVSRRVARGGRREVMACACRTQTSHYWGTQEGLMTTVASFPSVRNKGLIDQLEKCVNFGGVAS
jgi:hypothetical protein